MAAVAACDYISTVDVPEFFYSWPVRPQGQDRFTIVSHRGARNISNTDNGFQGIATVRSEKDRPYREFIRAYVDDMMIFSRTLEEHLRHLYTILSLFREIKMCLTPNRSYLGYPSVQLLGRHVDNLGLSRSKEKKHFWHWSSHRHWKNLEIYIGLGKLVERRRGGLRLKSGPTPSQKDSTTEIRPYRCG